MSGHPKPVPYRANCRYCRRKHPKPDGGGYRLSSDGWVHMAYDYPGSPIGRLYCGSTVETKQACVNTPPYDAQCPACHAFLFTEEGERIGAERFAILFPDEITHPNG